ncbi:MAG: glycolate oxidase subunit GlcE [Gammaproteobacteria bacterium]|nr:glycolate oxidase subunit GlcE [Gammaproteobacteria bacterium]
MNSGQDLSTELREHVLQAAAEDKRLELLGGGTKRFYGHPTTGVPLEISGHRGVVTYEPKELVMTVRAGTPLAWVEQALASEGQMLPFEPPHLGDRATVGGTLACGISGPRRPFTGAVRDFVLGARIINGRGDILRFGGEVMKNVAGYDTARLMAGSLGTLGVVLDVSFKVLPLPERELTLSRECSQPQALAEMNRLAGRPLPLSGACYDGRRLHIRLSGSSLAVAAGKNHIGGDEGHSQQLWQDLRELSLPFFNSPQPLWRLSVPASAPPLECTDKQFLDWGGAQRWLVSQAPPESIRTMVEKLGGHATLFRGGTRNQRIFHPLSQPLMILHQRLKQAFDPKGLFNSGRLFPEL